MFGGKSQVGLQGRAPASATHTVIVKAEQRSTQHMDLNKGMSEMPPEC